MNKPQVVTQIESIIGKELALAPVYPDLLTGLMIVKKGLAKYAMEGEELIGLNLVGLDLNEELWKKVMALPNITNLKGLNLSSNNFHSITLTEKFSNLEQLEICDNKQLKGITLLGKLLKLKRLILRDNKIEILTLPKKLAALSYLDASRNEMKGINFKENLPKVEYIDLSGNQLETFSIPAIFPNLYYLNIAGSKPTNIPSEIYEEKKNCWEDLSSYLRASLQSGDILNTEAKLVFFGNGRVGKTTLSHQLRTGEFDKTISITHGILVNEWTIKQEKFPESFLAKIESIRTTYKNRTGIELSIPENILLNVWDFGGQEYYHATHRLFLSNNIFYLVLWESSTNEQEEEKGNYPFQYWKANINHYSEKNTTLLVQNKEKGQATINHQELRYKIANRIDANQKSIQLYELDVEQLKEGIYEQLTSLEYLASPIAKIYDDIRKEVKQVKAEMPFLSFSDYKSLCQRLDNTAHQIMNNDQDIASLTKFLHETGCIICYQYKKDKESTVLNDYVFIDPKWVTTTIYQILDEKTIENDGEFNSEHVSKVLKESKNVIQDANLWIDLMCEFELVFKKDTEANTYIAPQYLSKSCKDLSQKAMNNYYEELPYQLTVSYPDFLARSTISRFICKYGNLAKDYYWKYGIVVHKEDEKALVECDYALRRITIHTKHHCSVLGVELFVTLRKIDNAPKLEVLVSELNNPGSLVGPVNILKLEEQLQKGRKYVEWRKREYDLGYFSGIFKPEEQTGKLGSKDMANSIKSTPIYFSYAWRDEENTERDVLVHKLYSSLTKEGLDIRIDKAQVKFGDSIENYMKEFGMAELIFVFLSKKYFKSKFCMQELHAIASWAKDDEEFRKKIIPIQVENFDYYRDDFRDELEDFWDDEKIKANRRIERAKKRTTHQSDKENRRLRKIMEMADEFSYLIEIIADINRESNKIYQEQGLTTIKSIIEERLSSLGDFPAKPRLIGLFTDSLDDIHSRLSELKIGMSSIIGLMEELPQKLKKELEEVFSKIDLSTENEYQLNEKNQELVESIHSAISDLPVELITQWQKIQAKSKEIADVKAKLKWNITIIPGILKYEAEVGKDLPIFKWARKYWSNFTLKSENK